MAGAGIRAWTLCTEILMPGARHLAVTPPPPLFNPTAGWPQVEGALKGLTALTRLDASSNQVTKLEVRCTAVHGTDNAPQPASLSASLPGAAQAYATALHCSGDKRPMGMLAIWGHRCSP